MKLINVVGDSLSLPRALEGIYLEDLYWYKLQECLGAKGYVVNQSRRANTTSLALANLTDDIVSRKADVLIIYLGIVDCFPRLFTKRQHALLDILPKVKLGLVSRQIINFASNHRYTLTRRFKKVYVPPEQFKSNLHKILLNVREQQAAGFVYLLGIVDTNDETRARTYGIDDNICLFNQIMREMALEEPSTTKFLDTTALLREAGIQQATLADGHHLTKQAHSCLSQILYRELGDRF